mmetsp:Transcript_123680/g.350243  ORF Transcript_123680/g.350243 Transcript_123680/m.350243 type:complete len:345 (+) Transcript_123680:541-1575(+)
MPMRTVNCTPTMHSGRAPSKAFSVKTKVALGRSTLPITVNSNSTSVGRARGAKLVQMPVQGEFGDPPTSCRQGFASLGFEGYFTSCAVMRPSRIGLPFSSAVEGPRDQRRSQSSPKASAHSNSSVFTAAAPSPPSAAASGESAAAAASSAGGRARSLSAAYRLGDWPAASSASAPREASGGNDAASSTTVATSSKPGMMLGRTFSAAALECCTTKTTWKPSAAQGSPSALAASLACEKASAPTGACLGSQYSSSFGCASASSSTHRLPSLMASRRAFPSSARAASTLCDFARRTRTCSCWTLQITAPALSQYDTTAHIAAGPGHTTQMCSPPQKACCSQAWSAR